MLHEILCAFSFGVNLSSKNVSAKMAIVFSIVLSASIPFGMLIMFSVDILLLLNNFISFNFQVGGLEETLALVLKFILEGLSAGIFLHVAILEMLAQEFAKHGKSDFIKAIVVIFGAGVAFGVNSFTI